jgi:Mn-dependent DtxR family transcriptional regulator
MKATLKPNEQVVLQILTRAATLGDVAPKNAYIAQSLGCSTPSTGAAIVARLEAKGLIRVHRFNDSRVIEIIATGAKTAGSLDKPKHFRHRA